MLVAALLVAGCGGDDDADGDALSADLVEVVCDDVQAAIGARARYLDGGGEEARSALGASVPRLRGLANDVGRVPASGAERARLLELQSLLDGASSEVALVLMGSSAEPDDGGSPSLDQLEARCP